MARRDKPDTQRVDTAGGSFLGLPAVIFDAPAWTHGAPFRMQAIVLAVARCWNGYNNGEIGISSRRLAELIGSANRAANTEALDLALARGFLECTEEHPKISKKANRYRLTWAQTGRPPAMLPATHDYRRWITPAAGDDEMPVFQFQRAAKHRANVSPPFLRGSETEPLEVRISNQGKERSGSETEPRETKVSTLRGSDIEPVIYLPLPPDPSPDSGASARPVPIKPQSMTEDAWLLAQKRAAKNPAMPASDHVKALTIDWLSRAGRGGQSQLTRALNVPPSTLSKFLTKGASLPERYRIPAVAWLVASGAKKAKAA